MTDLKLTSGERDRGWVEYACPEHGIVAAGPPVFDVRCRCGSRTVPGRRGKPLARARLAKLVRRYRASE